MNQYCNNFYTCAERCGFTNWRDCKLIGRGTFGEIFKLVVDFTNNDGTISMPVAVKKVLINFNYNTGDADEEANIFKVMSDLEISPELYCYFRTDKYQYFIMEKMDMNCIEVFNTDFGSDSITIKQLVLIDIITLIKSQIYYSGMWCTDIKFENFVVKFNDLVPKTRMIDFGIWCNRRDSEEWEHLDDYFENDDSKNLYFLLFILLQISHGLVIPEYLLDIINKEIDINISILKNDPNFYNKFKSIFYSKNSLISHYTNKDMHDLHPIIVEHYNKMY
jgi:serine/threonine protein kinase